jgi:hypothetical protein
MRPLSPKLDSKLVLKRNGVRIVLKQDVNRIKNGFSARSRELRISAHGQGVQRRWLRGNLEHAALLLLRPFERTGRLEAELASVPLVVEDDGSSEVQVSCGN